MNYSVIRNWNQLEYFKTQDRKLKQACSDGNLYNAQVAICGGARNYNEGLQAACKFNQPLLIQLMIQMRTDDYDTLFDYARHHCDYDFIAYVFKNAPSCLVQKYKSRIQKDYLYHCQRIKRELDDILKCLPLYDQNLLGIICQYVNPYEILTGLTVCETFRRLVFK
jgi:hypothetical protein